VKIWDYETFRELMRETGLTAGQIAVIVREWQKAEGRKV